MVTNKYSTNRQSEDNIAFCCSQNTWREVDHSNIMETLTPFAIWKTLCTFCTKYDSVSESYWLESLTHQSYLPAQLTQQQRKDKSVILPSVTTVALKYTLNKYMASLCWVPLVLPSAGAADTTVVVCLPKVCKRCNNAKFSKCCMYIMGNKHLHIQFGTASFI